MYNALNTGGEVLHFTAPDQTLHSPIPPVDVTQLSSCRTSVQLCPSSGGVDFYETYFPQESVVA